MPAGYIYSVYNVTDCSVLGFLIVHNDEICEIIL